MSINYPGEHCVPSPLQFFAGAQRMEMRVAKGHIFVSLERFKIKNQCQGRLTRLEKYQMASRFLHSMHHIEIANEALHNEKEEGKS